MLGNKAHNLKNGDRTSDISINSDVTFEGMILSQQTLDGLTSCGFEKPSPIQFKAIPYGKCGFDVIAQAKSGTGKTCMFSVITLEMLQLPSKSLQVLIITPTREIAVQVSDVLKMLGQHYEVLKIVTVIGGLPVEGDRRKVQGCHVVVGTPGRLCQLLQEKTVDLSHVRLVVLDEADKLLDKSFLHDVSNILSKLPEKKQTIASSATYTEELKTFLEKIMRSPIRITPENLEANNGNCVLLGVKQCVALMEPERNKLQRLKEKIKALLVIVSTVPFKQCIVFSNMIGQAEGICHVLNYKGFPTKMLSSAMNQPQRLEAVAALVNFQCRVLLSTDLSARGLDAANVDLVINLDIPGNEATYLHRVGRAGRFGSHGLVISIAQNTGWELEQLQNIAEHTKINLGYFVFHVSSPIPSELSELPSILDYNKSEPSETGSEMSEPANVSDAEFVSVKNEPEISSETVAVSGIIVPNKLENDSNINEQSVPVSGDIVVPKISENGSNISETVPLSEEIIIPKECNENCTKHDENITPKLPEISSSVNQSNPEISDSINSEQFKSLKDSISKLQILTEHTMAADPNDQLDASLDSSNPDQCAIQTFIDEAFDFVLSQSSEGENTPVDKSMFLNGNMEQTLALQEAYLEKGLLQPVTEAQHTEEALQTVLETDENSEMNSPKSLIHNDSEMTPSQSVLPFEIYDDPIDDGKVSVESKEENSFLDPLCDVTPDFSKCILVLDDDDGGKDEKDMNVSCLSEYNAVLESSPRKCGSSMLREVNLDVSSISSEPEEEISPEDPSGTNEPEASLLAFERDLEKNAVPVLEYSESVALLQHFGYLPKELASKDDENAPDTSQNVDQSEDPIINSGHPIMNLENSINNSEHIKLDTIQKTEEKNKPKFHLVHKLLPFYNKKRHNIYATPSDTDYKLPYRRSTLQMDKDLDSMLVHMYNCMNYRREPLEVSMLNYENLKDACKWYVPGPNTPEAFQESRDPIFERYLVLRRVHFLNGQVVINTKEKMYNNGGMLNYLQMLADGEEDANNYLGGGYRSSLNEDQWTMGKEAWLQHVKQAKDDGERSEDGHVAILKNEDGNVELSKAVDANVGGENERNVTIDSCQDVSVEGKEPEVEENDKQDAYNLTVSSRSQDAVSPSQQDTDSSEDDGPVNIGNQGPVIYGIQDIPVPQFVFCDPNDETQSGLVIKNEPGMSPNQGEEINGSSVSGTSGNNTSPGFVIKNEPGMSPNQGEEINESSVPGTSGNNTSPGFVIKTKPGMSPNQGEEINGSSVPGTSGNNTSPGFVIKNEPGMSPNQGEEINGSSVPGTSGNNTSPGFLIKNEPGMSPNQGEEINGFSVSGTSGNDTSPGFVIKTKPGMSPNQGEEINGSSVSATSGNNTSQGFVIKTEPGIEVNTDQESEEDDEEIETRSVGTQTENLYLGQLTDLFRQQVQMLQFMNQYLAYCSGMQRH